VTPENLFKKVMIIAAIIALIFVFWAFDLGRYLALSYVKGYHGPVPCGPKMKESLSYHNKQQY
jgi:hypothetical protein